jgi:hypothetical protein
VSKIKITAMKNVFVSSLLCAAMISLIACDNEQLSTSCKTPAIVRDLSGLDGCGFVLELNDGTILIPVPIFWCGTPPLPKEQAEDPLANFTFTDGKGVMIGYEELENISTICMAGKPVRITCIEEVSLIHSNE